MKHLHKFASVLLALAMALSLMVPAFAATVTPEVTTATVTIEGKLEDHQYRAYQIFTGVLSTDEKTLSNVEFGNGINKETFINELIALNITKGDSEENFFNTSMDASAVANAIAECGQAHASDIARAAYNAKVDAKAIEVKGTSVDLTVGYYLIVDETETPASPDDENFARNASLLQLVGDVTIKTKVDVPSVDKKVQEKEGGDYKDFGEAADYEVGDTVNFEFLSNVPDMSQFETYKYIFHDKMDAGLTFDADSVKVKIGDGDDFLASSEYSVVTSGLADGCTFEIRFNNLKDVAGATEGADIVITFSAKLNESAVIGSAGNKNTVNLEYSNNPNDGGDGTGKTPDDDVLVFTYELDSDKVNAAGENLAGAEFYLSNGNGDGQKWAKLDNNNKLTEWVDSQDQATKIVTEENQPFAILGLDAGTYYLYEVKAPDGYNTPADPFKIEISRTLIQEEGSEGYEDLTVTIDAVVGKSEKDVDAENNTNGGGVVGIEIVNQSGATLPETGGIGTTIFYTVGGILVAGAVILLVTKKRMSAEK